MGMDMEYDEAIERTCYAWRNGREFMTDVERKADRAGMVAVKATAAETDGSVSMARMLRKRWGAGDDPEVMEALAGGYEAFRDRVAVRLVSEVDGFLSRCPRCERIVRTPRARQCLWCKHTWRECP